MEIALQGTLQSFKLPGILTFLNMSEKTGTLHLQNSESEAVIYFDAGSLVYASSNEERFRLAAILIRKRKISEAQWKKLEETMLEQHEKFGRVAVEAAVLTEEELRSYLKIQASEIIYNSFTWNQGTFSFQDNLNLPDYAVTITIDLTNLLMEGARRIDEWAYFSKLLPDGNLVFRLSGNFNNQKKINLSLEEWKILFLINGRRTLEQICNESTEDPLDIYRVIYGLYVNQFLELVEGDEPTSTASLSPEERPTLKTAAGDSAADDTSLLVSPEARLSYNDVLKVTLAHLTLKEPEKERRIVPLIDQEYSIGRQMGTEIHISDPSISSIHARIFKGPEGYFLEDMNSRNGTYINGVRIDRKLLHDKDSIQIGNTNLVYNIVYEVKPLAAASR